MNRRGMLSGLLGLIPGLAALGLARRADASVALPRQRETDLRRLLTIQADSLSPDGIKQIVDAVQNTPHIEFCEQAMDVPKVDGEYMLRAVRNDLGTVFEWVPIRRMQVIHQISGEETDVESFGVMP